MDASNVVNAFVASANQYTLCQNDDNMKQFQRHLEILVCLTTEEHNLEFFKSRTLLSSQCVTHVVNVLLDNSSKLPLLTRALSVLQNLAVNSNVLKSLQSTFYVHSAISIFLQRYGINTKDVLVQQCLQLLESVTYGLKIDYIENHFENFLDILVQFVFSETSSILKSSLHILSNICRHNPKVQGFICGLPNIKQIFKKLIIIVNTEVPNVILYALSILSNITPYNNLGAKLWTEEHLMLTYDLIIKLVMCEDYSCATTAADLFADMILVPKYQSCLLKSPSLNRCLRKISKALYEASSKRSVLYLKILYSLTTIPDIMEKLCTILCVSSEAINEDQSSQKVKIHPKLVIWCCERSDVPTAVTVISLQLIKSIIMLYINKKFCYIEESVKDILENILKNVCSISDVNDASREEQFRVKFISFDLLLLLCEKTSMKTYISQNIKVDTCHTLIKSVLNACATDNAEFYNQTIDLFFTITETVTLLGDMLPDCDEFLCRLLQDDDAMRCVAFALTSDKKDRISRSLTLLSKSSGKCSLSTLSDSLLTRNLKPQSSQTFDSGMFSSSNLSLPSNSRKSISTIKYSESTIDSLMNKIENGLQIKDMKSSEIMDLYEHKIAMLTLKEQELQNYVDAKTAALQEADRIITQYKCRQADAEAEALRIRTMMKDYECRCESSAAQLSFEEQRRRKLESDLSQAYQKIRELEQNANEQREISQTQVNRLLEQKKNIEDEKVRLSEQISFKEQEKKLVLNQLQQLEEELRLKSKSLEDLQESKEDLIRVLEETKKSAEKLKTNSEQRQQQLQSIIDAAQQTIATLEGKLDNLMNEMATKSEQFSHRIADLESEKEQLIEQLKLRDMKIEDMVESIKKLNEDLNVKNCIIQENEASISKLRVTLEQTEARRTKLKQDKGMLELLCKKYEASIEEKDSEIQRISQELDSLRKESEQSISEKNSQIQHLEGELDKHKYITEMIHNMTSGRGLPPKS